MKSWKHMALTVRCASCGIEGTLLSMKDKEWINVMGRFYCPKPPCRQVAAMGPPRPKAPEAPR